MTTTLAVDANNDLFALPDGNLAVIRDQAAVIQMCEQFLKTMLKEMIYNQRAGVDYMNTIFLGVPDAEGFAASARENILMIPEVRRVESFGVVRVTGGAAFEAFIVTIYGEEAVSFGL